MNQLQIFRNEMFEVVAKVEGETVLFDAEHVAKCLGIVSRTTKNGVEYENVRWSRVNEFLPQVAEIGKGSLIPEPMVYKLAFKASNEVAEKFQDWLAIEVLPQIRKTGSYAGFTDEKKIAFETHLIGVEYASKILNVDETSKIKMLEEAHKCHGVPTNHLPQYVDDEVTMSLTALLKKNGVKMVAAKFNTKLIELGILEIKERPSSKGSMKEFKSITEKGLYYGKNLINPRNPKETQPHYYESKFSELIRMVVGEAA